MNTEGASGQLLDNVSTIIGVISAANTFDPEEFNKFVYGLVDGDTDNAIDLLSGVIAFFFGMTDAVGIDMDMMLRNFGIAAAEQRSNVDHD